MAEESQTLIVPLDEATFQSENTPGSEFKYRYRLNLNPGTSRHLLESTKEISIGNVVNHATFGSQNLITIRVHGTTRVVHEEGDHAPIYLPAGQYSARVLLEFDPWGESEIAVFD